ncbi:MAG: transposase, partial [Gammaproteobacteria bacterium]
MATRRELVETVGVRYRASTVAERSAILDEFVSITGYHRKHAIRLLSAPFTAPEARRRSVRYGPAVR